MTTKWSRLHAAGMAGILMLLSLAGCMRAYPPASENLQQTADAPYLIGPGDTLNILVWRNPELSMVVPVRPDGKLTTPLVEDLSATGKTASQLAREIEKELSKYIQNPVVTVVVTNFVGPYSEQIRVIGEASKPQALPYRANMTLLDVMIAVGGITDFAAGNKASILRRNGSQSEQFGVRIQDLIRGGDLSANLKMRPGDVVVIPQSAF
ncbi:MAG: XrtA/PEP-CTERM system exopolysaccharide export protein [Rhodospirillaceae bacterium]